MTAAPETRIALVREQISALTDQGLDSVDIAARLGLTVSRVDQILDQLEGAHLAALPPQKTTTRPALIPAPAAEPRPRVQVQWLIPRGLDHTDMRAEYAIERPGGGVQIVGFATAELHAADGTKILTRWTTNWVNAR